MIFPFREDHFSIFIFFLNKINRLISSLYFLSRSVAFNKCDTTNLESSDRIIPTCLSECIYSEINDMYSAKLKQHLVLE